MSNIRVSLLGGYDEYEGKVFIDYDGPNGTANGTICSKDFNYEDAMAVCRMLWPNT